MIPKLLHLVWFSGNLSAYALRNIALWEQTNPDLHIKVWDSKKLIESFPLSNIIIDLLNSDLPYVNKSDFARLIPLLYEGGIYADTDMRPQKSINKFLQYSSFAGISYEPNYVGNALVGFIPNHPIIRELLKDNVDRIYNNKTDAILFPEYYGVNLHGLYFKDVELLLPRHYFYPFSWNNPERRRFMYPRSYAVHEWSGCEGWTKDRITRVQNTPKKLRPCHPYW